MTNTLHSVLTRRERQIMDILYRRRRAPVADVMTDMTGDLSYSTVRTQLRVMEQKGHVRHDKEGLCYVYIPTVPRGTARRSALTHLLDTFFDGSTEKVVATLLGLAGGQLSDDDLTRIADLVARARDKGAKRRT